MAYQDVVPAGSVQIDSWRENSVEVASPTALAPLGTVPGGYAQIVANSAAFSAQTDTVGLAITVTTVAGRRYRLSAFSQGIYGTAGEVFSLELWEGGTRLQACTGTCAAAVPYNGTMAPSVILVAPTPGAHTYKVSAIRNSGTNTAVVGAGVQSPTYILLEDIGV